MSLVSLCPRTEAEFSKASQRIGCGIDTNGHDLYICIPNEEKTSLVEFCHNEVMGAQEKGHCLEASFGKIIQYNCRNFLSGCPNDTFFEYGFYKYPACQNINTKHNCYVMDPSCPSIVPADDKRHTDSDDALVYACSILGSVIVLLIVALIFAIIKYRRKNTGRNTDSTQPAHPEGTSFINQENESVAANQDTNQVPGVKKSSCLGSICSNMCKGKTSRDR